MAVNNYCFFESRGQVFPAFERHHGGFKYVRVCEHLDNYCLTDKAEFKEIQWFFYFFNNVQPYWKSELVRGKSWKIY